ncbi:hypothetical protein BURPS1106B_A1144 [Burkholderia pseudomallei 1106b]|nr:hypothetical protein BURPS1106B_A1144 [Burkholderia pseudomallei 1106b]
MHECESVRRNVCLPAHEKWSAECGRAAASPAARAGPLR